MPLSQKCSVSGYALWRMRETALLSQMPFAYGATFEAVPATPHTGFVAPAALYPRNDKLPHWQKLFRDAQPR